MGWFHPRSINHSVNLKTFKDLPPKFVIGPDVILSLAKLEGIDTFVSYRDVFMYIGIKKLTSNQLCFTKKKNLTLNQII